MSALVGFAIGFACGGVLTMLALILLAHRDEKGRSKPDHYADG